MLITKNGESQLVKKEESEILFRKYNGSIEDSPEWHKSQNVSAEEKQAGTSSRRKQKCHKEVRDMYLTDIYWRMSVICEQNKYIQMSDLCALQKIKKIKK